MYGGIISNLKIVIAGRGKVLTKEIWHQRTDKHLPRSGNELTMSSNVSQITSVDQLAGDNGNCLGC